MLSRRQIWQARQRFLRAIEETRAEIPKVFASTVSSIDSDVEYYQHVIARWRRNYSHPMSEADRRYTENRIAEYERCLEQLEQRRADMVGKPLKILDWLRDCGLHPFIFQGEVSYCPKGKRRHRWSHRQKMKLERFITRLAPMDAQMDDSCNLETLCKYLMTSARKFVVRFIQGSDIIEAYRVRVGGESCMTGENPRLRLYEENPQSVCMAVVCYDDMKEMSLADIRNCSVRCLVWNTTKGPYIDRMYYSGGLNLVHHIINPLVESAVHAKYGQKVVGQYGRHEGAELSEAYIVCKPPSNLNDSCLPYLDSMSLMVHEAELVFAHHCASRSRIAAQYRAQYAQNV